MEEFGPCRLPSVWGGSANGLSAIGAQGNAVADDNYSLRPFALRVEQ